MVQAAVAPPSAVKAAVPRVPGTAGPVSYYKQVRPLFVSRCEGCHQGAKLSGSYLMTEFPKLVAGGASGKTAIVPGQPSRSHLITMITPVGGKAKMPPTGDPLSASEIDLVKRWVTQGAKDDSTVYERARFDTEHPPTYTRAPLVTSMDFSPDGKYLAVTGFHEVLLLAADTGERVARLVGKSERVESVSFSPDGARLAVSGGQPARRGEVQIWDVATRKQLLSVTATGDTVYGASWSPDGKLVAFGCSDNTVRAIDSTTGQQVLQQGSHNDWVLDTVFSTDSSHLVSVGRDRTAKLTEIATQRFIDNITSITPGALKGGLAAVARHPERDEIVVGGADGIPGVFRIYRQTKREIGDNANLIKELPALKGRINTVAVSDDGTHIAAGSSLDGTGQVALYAYKFTGELPADIKKIQSKRVMARSAAEKAELAKYVTGNVERTALLDVPQSGIYSVSFSADGKTLAVAGTDGEVRYIDAEAGAVQKTFTAVPLSNPAAVANAASTGPARRPEDVVTTKIAAPKVARLEVQPAAIKLTGGYDYAQILVTGRTATGEAVDVTRYVQSQLSAPLVAISATGLVQPRADGTGSIKLLLGDKSISVPVSVAGVKASRPVDYVRDVQPVMSKVGCNQGTCHGSKDGKNGFKLSLRGYDPIYDVRALTDELASRRVNIASPDDSLMLLKATGAVPHVGGGVMQRGDAYYAILRSWIAAGAKLDLKTPRVTEIAVSPKNPVVQQIGSTQQIRVIAKYADGTSRDVTREAFIETGNMEVAGANRSGLVSSLRRGEAPMLVRYEGNYAATTLTVMGDRTGFAWKQPQSYGPIDELAAAKWKRMKIEPSGLCTDAEFVRRVHLDLTGLPPTADEIRAFLADPKDSRAKRDALVERLVGSNDFVEYWTNKWADLLQVNRKFLGVEGATAFRKWIRDQVAANRPYDQFASEILTASGSNREHPAASYYKILRQPDATMENTTHLFLAVRFNCNKCHDHPFERWTQDQYYQMAAYFAQVNLAKDPMSGNQLIGGTAVEGGKPLYEMVTDATTGEVKHDRTGEVTPPKFPFPVNYQAKAEHPSRRQQLAGWITSKENPLFAKSYVNRLWGYMFGVGIIEPIDDIRAGNPATNPELLDYLTREFVNSGFNVQALIKQIVKSRTYQLSVGTNQWNTDDRTNYSHALARRLPAEVLYDTVHRVTGAVSKIPGVPTGTRAAELPDSGVELESGFFGTFGRPARESACECERSSGLQLGPVMALISGPTISNAIDDPANELAKFVAKEQDDRKLVDELFLRILNRPATEKEIKATLASMQGVGQDHLKLVAALKQREAEVKPLRVKQEKEREHNIAAAKAELATYEKALAPRLVEAERQKAERTAALQGELKTYEGTLPAKIADWEKKQNTGVQWMPLDPSALSTSFGVKLVKQPDMSVVASGPQGRGTYTLVANTNLKGITAVRLEALPDASFPQGGPGRAPDGNFVLTEFEVKAAPMADPSKAGKVTLQNPLADFSQVNFDVSLAVNGDAANAGQGWACSPALGGVPHWATFQTAQPVGFDGGTQLTITLHHQFSGDVYSLGRFRISVATAAQPVGLSLADDLKTIIATAQDARTAEQQAYLLKYYRSVDADLRQRQSAVGLSLQPLPVDAKLTELKNQVELASKPVPEDARLVQLRTDAAASEKQAANQRLTAAQDLAWALINSPAFLFNH
jgi:WD40 repeat protein